MKNARLLFLFLLPLLVACGDTPTTVVTDTVQQKDSLAILNDSIRLDPNNLALYHKRAKYYMSANDLAAALADINRVLAIDSSNSEYLITGADIHFFVNKTQRADQLLRRAVEVDPENTACMLRLAQLHHYLKRYDEEVELLNKVLDIDRRNAQAYFMRGMVAKEKGDTAGAMREMQMSTQMDPDYYNAYIQMGVLSASQGSPAAVDFYRNALQIQPTSIEALYNLGMYYQENNQHRLAINSYLSILQINPMYFDAHFNLGYIYTDELDSLDQGLKYFELAIRDNPAEPRGYFGRGKCYEKMGNLNAASADYKKALELDPQYTSPALALDRIAK